MKVQEIVLSELPPNVAALRVVCSWCRREMKPSRIEAEAGIANYGMCKRCLSLGLRKLTVSRSAPPN